MIIKPIDSDITRASAAKLFKKAREVAPFHPIQTKTGLGHNGQATRLFRE